MRPLSEMPREVRARIDGVVFDVDDTITRDGRVEAAAFQALWDLHRAGVRLLLVTGRPLGWCDVWARTWPVDAAVGENGAGWVWRQGAAVHEGHPYGEGARTRHGEVLTRVRRRVAHQLPEVPLASDQAARRCDLAFDVGETVRLPQPTVDRLVSAIADEGARAVVSTVHAHAMPGDWDKARGAAGAAEQVLGLSLEAARDRWVFVGDSGNDAAAFAWFGHTVGVANVRDAVDRLPAPPRWVTPSDRGQGFAELARSLLDAR